MAYCEAITRRGGTCKTGALSGAPWCKNHHPDYAEWRSEKARKGGIIAGRGRPQAATELALMRKKIVGDLNAVRLGAIPPNRAGVLFQGYGQLIAAYREEERQLSKDAMGLEEVAALFDKFLAVVLAHVPDIGTRLLIGAGIGALMDGIGVPEVSSVGNQLPEIISVK